MFPIHVFTLCLGVDHRYWRETIHRCVIHIFDATDSTSPWHDLKGKVDKVGSCQPEAQGEGTFHYISIYFLGGPIELQNPQSITGYDLWTWNSYIQQVIRLLSGGSMVWQTIWRGRPMQIHGVELLCSLGFKDQRKISIKTQGEIRRRSGDQIPKQCFFLYV